MGLTGLRRNVWWLCHLVVILGVSIHGLWAVALFMSETPMKITAISGSAGIMGGRYILASCYAVVSVLVTMSLGGRLRGSLVSMALILQQFFLTLSMFSAGKAIYFSQFANGVVRSRWFIACDQGPWLLLSIVHTVSVIGVVVLRPVFKDLDYGIK